MNAKKMAIIKKMTKQGYTPLQQLHMQELAKKMASEVEKESTRNAVILMLGIPCMVLADEYWSKTASKRIPIFMDKVMKYLHDVEEGLITFDDIHTYLKEEYDYTVIDREDLR